MAIDDLLAWLRARPFRPFRMVMVEGLSYEVRHPELCMVTEWGGAVVGYPSTRHEGAVSRHDLVSLAHVVRLEHVEQNAEQF